jgi:RNA polymerase sigma factor (sigma-70 family)
MTESATEFERRWNSVNTRISAYFYRNGCPQEDVRDLTQEVAYRAFRSYPTLQGDFQAWIHTITRRVFADYVRTRKQVFQVESEEEIRDPKSDPGTVIVMRELLAQCLQELDPKERECLYCYDVLGWKYEEIGEKLGISRSNAHYHVENARKRLRAIFPELAQEYGVKKKDGVM